jgi:uncharacterized delta-60 repeat protein
MKNHFLSCLIVLLASMAYSQPPGTLDLSFGETGFVVTAMSDTDNCGRAIALQADGKIVFAGSPYEAQNSYFIVIRYNTDGTLDNTFGTGGIAITVLEDNTVRKPFRWPSKPMKGLSLQDITAINPPFMETKP